MKPAPALISVLLLPLAAALIAACLWFFVNPPPSLTRGEKELLGFIPAKVALAGSVARSVSGVNCPIPPVPPPSAAVSRSQGVYPPVPLDALVLSAGGVAKKGLPQKPAYHLSLVLFDEGRKMAILNGHVLKEGDALGLETVSLIEKERVKLKGAKGELWVNLK